MQPLKIRRIGSISRAEDVSTIFEGEHIDYNTLTHVNWADYPYRPDVRFGIAHDGKRIYLHWLVDEQEIKAVCEEDCGEVWRDSCVEFFVSFNDSFYYNIECNCIGKVLIQTGVDRHSRVVVESKLIEKIERWSTLGNQAIEGQSGRWELSLIIPVELFHLNSFSCFDGLEGAANFYKCGDALQQPHFVSWSPINSESPNFHLSPFFAKLIFE